MRGGIGELPYTKLRIWQDLAIPGLLGMSACCRSAKE